jgi:glycosyltransferase involved in cell wall biosynthesis
LIVVDDGSTDGGAHLVAALSDSRISLVSQANAGVSVARNTGLLRARGDWVALLDADDYWREDHLARLAELALRYPDAAMLGSSYGFVAEAGAWRRVPIRDEYLKAQSGFVEVTDFFDDAVSLEHLPMTASSVMLPREWALKLGGFPAGVTAGEDQLVWAKMACAGLVALSVEPTSVYVEPAVSAATRQAVVRRPQLPDVVGTELQLLLKTCRQPKSIRLFVADWYRIRAVSWMELNERWLCLTDVGRAVNHSQITLKDVICLLALLMPKGLRSRLLAARRERIRREAALVGAGQ